MLAAGALSSASLFCVWFVAHIYQINLTEQALCSNIHAIVLIEGIAFPVLGAAHP